MHWRCPGPAIKLSAGLPGGKQTLQQELWENSLAFEAHPLLHRFLWAVPDTTPNRPMTAALQRQAFCFFKKELVRLLDDFTDMMEARA